MKITLVILLLLLPWLSVAQLQESFSDGNFTQNPSWSGDVTGFVVNANKQLQSNGPAVTGTVLQLTTPMRAVVGTTWEFWANLKLETSSSNYTDIYLIADSPDLKNTNTSGYFVRIGGTADEVSLFRKDAGRTPVMIINGQDKTIATANNIVRVRVKRSIAYEWTLEIDITGTGQSFVSQGISTDATYKRSEYMGVLVRYTSANSQKFYFDDFIITDNQAPALRDVRTISSQELELLFNEPLNQQDAAVLANYTLNGNLKPVSASLSEAGTVKLSFAQSFLSGSNNTISIAGLSDLYGNILPVPVVRVFPFALPAVLPGYNELLITEIMADESPVVGLPLQEYIELYNPTGKVLILKGIRFSDATSTAILPDVQLQPGEYAVVVPNTQVSNFTQFGKVIGISNFPGLNNSGELLTLRQPNGKLIYAVNYSDSWYKDLNKKDGGWSLEMIDVRNPCSGSENWKASVDLRGGTPAQPNSVAASIPDNSPPVLVTVIVLAADRLLIRFGEKLDSSQAALVSNYSINQDISIKSVQVQGPLFTDVVLQLNTQLQEQQLYTLTVTSIRDCAGNLSGSQKNDFALPSAPEPGDVVINEILFNPRPNGVDFVELVNRSEKYITLKDWKLANSSAGTISNIKVITTEHIILGPRQYVVLTVNPENVKMNYPAAREEKFLRMSSFPSFPDSHGTVIVLQPDNRVADRFEYDEKMHFSLIDDVNGVSLERIRLEGPTIASNFHSASTTVSATPGYINSQLQGSIAVHGLFKIEPQVFSPDGDGYQDFTTINYSTATTGFVANITVFDAQGREIRKLVRNELLASNGFFVWDGLKDDGSKATIGYYLFYIELFNLNGQKQQFKEKVVVGGRF
jgi:hypothetical protein